MLKVKHINRLPKIQSKFYTFVSPNKAFTKYINHVSRK